MDVDEHFVSPSKADVKNHEPLPFKTATPIDIILVTRCGGVSWRNLAEKPECLGYRTGFQKGISILLYQLNNFPEYEVQSI